MSAEKSAAFYESWAAMGLAAMKAQQSLAASMLRSWTTVPSTAALTNQTLRVLSQGMAPVHRRAVSNAKRLGRLKK
jgi:hypothetical protein